ncbi:PAS domain S-box-containing protein/TyrR family helix-turn-helix domain-containing protein [Syntrophus gentianae]|uniref:HTH-type transcriptional regulatory protein TyrR n=1 Tax=Syntrophus gentianae TaxID=43775 RepID=A0A1H7WD29_9BACT|nr:sigma 54-interacting transcriptional regulator [Syntrophus gentianae]SEM19423.1 PAS domain S-box-containing protein/TyrR family helix-turn-helix domain-containing protein [Syntrophus gentianae]
MEELPPLVLERISEGILAVDHEEMVIACNTAAQKMLEVDARVIGTPLQSIPGAAELSAFLKSKNNPQDQRFTCHNRSFVVRSFSGLGSDFADGTLFLIRDVTELDKIKAELQSQEKLNKELEDIIASSHDGILITDGEGNVLKINEALLRITGLTQEHFIGHKMESLYENGHFFSQSIESLARKRKKIVTGIQKTRTGKEVMVTATPVFDEAGNILRLVTNARDMSEIRSLQEELAQSRELSNRLQTEVNRMLEDEWRSNGMITANPAMVEILELSRRVAGSEATVLIQGESGVGKEVLAKLIHLWSKRPGAFIKVNCGAIPQHLLESELFGYNRGAFTGANKEGKPGIFELAADGTLFLDEIEDLPLDLQVKFLQVIQDRAFLRLGGTKVIRVNVRLIAASNRELSNLVAERKFREDLFYRLNVVPITLPPLREREEDIPLLVDYFLNRYNDKYGGGKFLAPALLQKFSNYNWPGNVRELKNMIERLVVTCPGNLIDADFPEMGQNNPSQTPAGEPVESGKDAPEEVFSTLKEVMESVEKDMLSKALKNFRNSRQIGRMLGISHTAVLKKIKKYSLQ